MPALTSSSGSDYSLISSLDALSITSSGRPSPLPPSGTLNTASASSQRAGKRKQHLTDTNHNLIMPTPALSGSGVGDSSIDTQSGVGALTRASLAKLIDIRQHPRSNRVQSTMPKTRSQSRATSEVPTTSSSFVEVKHEDDAEEVEREISPSLLHRIPKEESSPPPSPILTPAGEEAISIQLSGIMIKVEVMDSNEEAEMMDDVPELSHFGALRLSEIPRIKTPGPGSLMSIEDAHSTVESFLNSRSSFVSDKNNKLRLWQSLCIELGLVAVKEENDLTPTLPATQTEWTQGPLPPLPTSLTAAKTLLKERAHVNINQYLEARKQPVVAGQRRDLSHLLHGDIRKLAKYTKKTKNYTPKDFAKDEWLQPLMRTLRFRGGQARK